MSPVNTPENPADATSAPSAPAAAPKRRRRVVRDVVTPAAPVAPVDTPVEPVPVAEPVAVVDPAPAAEPAPATQSAPATEPAPPAAATAVADAAPTAAQPPRARRSRRVTRTVVLDGTPAPAADVAPDTAPAVTGYATVVAPGGPEEDVEEAVEELPAADADTAGDADTAAVEQDDAPVEEEPTAPKRRRSTRRGGRAARAAQQDRSAGDGGLDGDPSAADAPTADAPTADAPVGADLPAAPEQPADVPLDVLAELGPVRTGQDAPARARLATTALLFQAPEPAARGRRRRAQTSAGSPQEVSEAARADDVQADVAPEAPTTPDAEATEAAGEPGTRSRRRRGRGRQAAGDDAPETADALPDADRIEDDTVEEAPDTQEPGPHTEDAGAEDAGSTRRRRRRGGRGRRGRTDAAGDDDATEDAVTEEEADPAEDDAPGEPGEDEQGGSSRRRRRRRRGSRTEGAEEPRRRPAGDEVTALRGSTRLEAKRQRRREGRDAGRRRQIITEAEFLARRESVERAMVVRELDGRTQIAVLEDGVLVEHYVSHQAQASMVGNVYLGRVQNVLPSMEAAFVDVGKGRNAVLYAGEVNWDAAGLEGQPRRIEQALKSGDAVLVQVTKDPIGHKGARLTSQITLAGRYLVYVPGGGMTGISRKLPDTERSRLKKILRDLVPESAGVIVRTAAEGASEDELRADVARLQGQWEAIEKKRRTANAPALLQGEPDMAIRVVRDIFNDDFSSLVVQGDAAWSTISGYVGELAPDLAARVEKWTGTQDVFSVHRVDEQLAKGMDRKVWLPSGGSLVIDRTEAMTVVDVNTGKFTGAGGTLEETVTRNNLEAAEEIVRQLRLRDIGGIIVIDFIDMVLESNRDLVLRRLVECLGRDRTKHQVAEVTSLGLVQMTRKRVGQGLVEAFSETCEHCHGRGFIVHTDPVAKGGRPETPPAAPAAEPAESKRSRRKRAAAEAAGGTAAVPTVPVLPEARAAVKATLATIAAAAAHAHDAPVADAPQVADAPVADAPQVPDAPASGEAAPLDVVAELGAAGLGTAGGAVETDAPLELHAVAPEVFDALEDGDASDAEHDGAAPADGD